jgi:hypothetical protein
MEVALDLREIEIEAMQCISHDNCASASEPGDGRLYHVCHVGGFDVSVAIIPHFRSVALFWSQFLAELFAKLWIVHNGARGK